eukprot:COSAG02_NODE_9268_length_2272_cov_1.151334_2_plen_467_part_00
MEEIVANALALDSDDTTKVEKVLERDSNAVQSHVFPEWKKIGALLANEAGGPSPVCYVAQGLCVAVGGAMFFASVVLSGGRALYYIAGVLVGLCVPAFSLCVTSTRVALMSGGKLDQLGAGEVMVSEGDAASMARRRKGDIAFSAFLALAGLCLTVLFFASFVLSWSEVPDDHVAAIRLVLLSAGLVDLTVAPAIGSGWPGSMRTASCLCRDAVVEVVKDVRATDPTDEEQWEARVSQPALALREKFELLSDGWSSGLLGVILGCWLLSLGQFARCLDPLIAQHERARDLASVAIFALIPFWIAMDIADTSSWCDTLMAELNDVRIKHGKAGHLNIQCLETSLKQLVRCPFKEYLPTSMQRQCLPLAYRSHASAPWQNNGQGLGFVLAGSVLDKRSLKAAFVKLISTLSTVISYLLVLADDVATNTAAGGAMCDLTAVQKATVRSVLAERNESCSYNMTVASVLGD